MARAAPRRAGVIIPEADSRMTSRELRQSFLDFFGRNDHHILPSAPLKPSDETTLFTSAGMQQFVPWFRGLVPPAHPRVVTCQKCFRADDIEHVGHTPRHSTFFEMLGNFSFGDYFKEGAVEYAWEYVTTALDMPKARIWVTVHSDDHESPGLWQRVAGIPAGRVVADPTNWWGPVGKSGPCGPCTEIILDAGEELGCGRPGCSPLCDCRRWTELWNLVFQTSNRTESGELQPLPKLGIDTGMGMERMTALMQGVPTIFETDLLAPIMTAVLEVARRANSRLPEKLDDRQAIAAKIITDHSRALAFLLADGFTPSNDGAGYVVRRVLRRAYRLGRDLGIEEPFVFRLVPSIVETMGDVYPEVKAARARIATWLEQEEKQFEETLERSYAPLVAAIEKAKAAGATTLPGGEAFKLHDTYGLPKELAADIAAESGLALDEEGFARAMEEQRDRARARAAQDFAFAVRAGYDRFVGKTTFLGYEGCGGEGAVIAIIQDGEPKDQLGAGEEGEVFLDQTPFYAEAGGQVGDRGRLESGGAAAVVLDSHYPVEGAHAHRVRVERGQLKVGDRVLAQVDRARRQAIARAHTATHLLHHVLRAVLGEHALQSGSLVDADRLRFDFAHFSGLTPEEKERIEDEVVRLALGDDELITQDMTLEEARALGATALFGEKYGERVRVVQIGEFSCELCGGTHLPRGSAIGGFAIVSEGSIGTGLRRIEAVTGLEAQALARRQREWLSAAAEALHATPEGLADRAGSLQEELRRAQREISRLQQKSAGALAAELVGEVQEVGGVKLLAARAELPPEALRSLADDLIRRLGSGIVVLASEHGGRAHLVAGVSKDLVSSGFHAGSLIREVAKVAGGGGGGRPDFAQAGGKNPERLDEALVKARELVAAHRG
jgi:alanyl-tRNA synthetase